MGATDDANKDSIVVLTYATHSQGTFECLRQSCTKWGYALRVLGWQTKWLGYGQKLQAIRGALQKLTENQMIMFVDAFDVVMCGPPTDAVAGFRRAGSPKILVGASRALKGGETAHRIRFQDKSSKSQPVRCERSPYQWLCSGTYMGRAGDCLELISSLKVEPKDDDQVLMTTLRDKFGDKVVQLDCRFDVFATLMPAYLNGPVRKSDKITVVHDDVNDGRARIHSGVTGTRPCVVHGPAHCKLDALMRQLGMGQCVQQTPLSYKMKKIWYHARETAAARDTQTLLIAVGAIVLLFVVALVGYMVKRHGVYAKTTESNERDAQQDSREQHDVD